MRKLILSFILLISLASFSSAIKLRSEEDIKNRDAMLAYVDEFAETFKREHNRFQETGNRSATLDGMIKMMKLPPVLFRAEWGEMPPDAAILSCLACRSTVALWLSQYRAGTIDANQVAQNAINLCMQLTDFGIVVCEGTVMKNMEIFIFIIDNDPTLTANQICSLVLQGECGEPDQRFDFRINVSPGPPITQSKSEFTPRAPNEIKILHFSDPHYDPAYLVGGFANCPEPVCCRRDRGIAANPADRAGRWGDFRDCDSPWEVVEDALRAARRDHAQVDYVYITGDIVDHGVWETTHAGNIQIINRFHNLVRAVFPNTPVYSVLGNHEAQPTNVFAPPHITQPSMSTQWLYDRLAIEWQHWLPGAAQQSTIRRGGHYTVLAQPGFRIVAMNNMDCYNFNFWLLYSRSEAVFHLQWLHDTLLAAENANERVHLLYHIPSGGGSCIKWWSREFRRVVDRFHRIISGQFTGHSHRDEFNIFYASGNHNFAVNYNWNGGATTTFSFVNPNYAVYYVDRVLFQVNEKESWMYNIEEANLNEATPPRWFRHYSMTQAWGLPNLSPAALDNFVTNTLSRSRARLRQYLEWRTSNASPMMNAPCDDECLRGHLCQIVINEFNDLAKCNQLRSFPLA